LIRLFCCRRLSSSSLLFWLLCLCFWFCSLSFSRSSSFSRNSVFLRTRALLIGPSKESGTVCAESGLTRRSASSQWERLIRRPPCRRRSRLPPQPFWRISPPLWLWLRRVRVRGQEPPCPIYRRRGRNLMILRPLRCLWAESSRAWRESPVRWSVGTSQLIRPPMLPAEP